MAEFRPALTPGGTTGLEAEIFLYDTLPGGAGFSTQLAESPVDLFQAALNLLTRCPEGCDASCYRCLRSFKNKFEHSLMDRHVGAQLLQYPVLCRRIGDILAGQLSLPPDCPPALESHAQRIAAHLLAHERVGTPASPASRGRDVQHVDIDSLELIRPRSVGVEHVGLWAMDQLGLRTLFAELGMGASMSAAAVGSIIARMAQPGSERAARRWLGERSALDELPGVEFATFGPMRLYRASDALMAHREAIEFCLAARWTCSTSTPPSRSTT